MDSCLRTSDQEAGLVPPHTQGEISRSSRQTTPNKLGNFLAGLPAVYSTKSGLYLVVKILKQQGVVEEWPEIIVSSSSNP